MYLYLTFTPLCVECRLENLESTLYQFRVLEIFFLSFFVSWT